MKFAAVNVSIIGLGRVGSSLAARMLAEESRDISLNLMDTDPMIEGAQMEFQHAAALGGHALTANGRQELSQADLVFFCAGKVSRRGASRLSVRKMNVDLALEIFRGIRFKKQPMIVAISNPVDIVTHHIRKLGVTDEYETHGEPVKAWVLGEHGNSMVPVYSQSLVSGNPLPAGKRYRHKLERCTHLLRTSATRIRMTQPATRWGVSECAFRIYKAFAGDVDFHFPLSVKPDLHFAKICRAKEISIGLPVKLDPDGIKVNGNFQLTLDESELLSASARVIQRNL